MLAIRPCDELPTTQLTRCAHHASRGRKVAFPIACTRVLSKITLLWRQVYSNPFGYCVGM